MSSKIEPKDRTGFRDYLETVLTNARANFRWLSWKQALRLWPAIANFAFTTMASALLAICILSGTKIGRFSSLYVLRVRVHRGDSRETLIDVQISLHETQLIDDIKNVVKSSTIAEKVLSSVLDNVGVPNELSVYLTAYCVVPRSAENARPPRCVPTSFRYYVYGGFSALLIISLWSIIFPRTPARNDKSSWSPLQIAWAVILAIYTHLAFDVFVISYNLGYGKQSEYLTVQQGGLFLGLVGVVYICLAGVLVISSLQQNKQVSPAVR
jgi:hypothetical protein